MNIFTIVGLALTMGVLQMMSISAAAWDLGKLVAPSKNTAVIGSVAVGEGAEKSAVIVK